MENIDKILITCPECGAACTDMVPLGPGEWLVTCGDCYTQGVVADEDIAKAKADGRKSLSGKPLGSGAAKSEEESPLVRNARMRAEREV